VFEILFLNVINKDKIMRKIISSIFIGFLLTNNASAAVIIPQEKLYFSKINRSVGLSLKNDNDYAITYEIVLGEKSSKDFKLFPKKGTINPKIYSKFLLKYISKDTPEEYCEMILLKQIGDNHTSTPNNNIEQPSTAITARVDTLINLSLPLCVFKSDKNINRDFKINKVESGKDKISITLTKNNENIVQGRIIINSDQEKITEKRLLLMPENASKTYDIKLPKMPSTFTIEVDSLSLDNKVLDHQVYNKK
jgi:hypothetical protein